MFLMKTQFDEIIGLYVDEGKDPKHSGEPRKHIIFYAAGPTKDFKIVDKPPAICEIKPAMKINLTKDDIFLAVENCFEIKGDGKGILFENIFGMESLRSTSENNFLMESPSDDKYLEIENILVLSWS